MRTLKYKHKISSIVISLCIDHQRDETAKSTLGDSSKSRFNSKQCWTWTCSLHRVSINFIHSNAKVNSQPRLAMISSKIPIIITMFFITTWLSQGELLQLQTLALGICGDKFCDTLDIHWVSNWSGDGVYEGHRLVGFWLQSDLGGGPHLHINNHFQNWLKHLLSFIAVNTESMSWMMNHDWWLRPRWWGWWWGTWMRTSGRRATTMIMRVVK